MSTQQRFCTRSSEQTIFLGGRLTELLAPARGQSRMMILRGDLGAGKTTLVKGIASAMGLAQPEDVTSPTFTLVHEYAGGNARLYHLDLYRLETERELLTLGIEDMETPGSLILVEWGEKFPSVLARADGEISIAIEAEDERTITVEMR
ncbi:MAG: tRNA (adenosine(37)-N6)-threonylcarbamoyltransferase complex ATPase subunit type 1 TsaE [Acidobacteriaceae bacterium]